MQGGLVAFHRTLRQRACKGQHGAQATFGQLLRCAVGGHRNLRGIGRQGVQPCAVMCGDLVRTGQATGVQGHQQALVQADAFQRRIEQGVVAALGGDCNFFALVAQGVQTAARLQAGQFVDDIVVDVVFHLRRHETSFRVGCAERARCAPIAFLRNSWACCQECLSACALATGSPPPVLMRLETGCA